MYVLGTASRMLLDVLYTPWCSLLEARCRDQLVHSEYVSYDLLDTHIPILEDVHPPSNGVALITKYVWIPKIGEDHTSYIYIYIHTYVYIYIYVYIHIYIYYIYRNIYYNICT